MAKILRDMEKKPKNIQVDLLGKLKYKDTSVKNTLNNISTAVDKIGSLLYKAGNYDEDMLLKIYTDIGEKSDVEYCIVSPKYTRLEYNDKSPLYLARRDIISKSAILSEKGDDSKIISLVQLSGGKELGRGKDLRGGKELITYIVPKKDFNKRYSTYRGKKEPVVPNVRYESGDIRLKMAISYLRVYSYESILGVNYILEEFIRDNRLLCSNNEYLTNLYSLAYLLLSNLKSSKDDLTIINRFYKEQVKDLFNYLYDRTLQYNKRLLQYNYEKDKLKTEKGSKAKTYEDKKYVRNKVDEVAKNNPINKLGIFDYIELDDTADIEVFKNFCEDFIENQKYIPKIKTENKPILRFRKLGHLKASGVFFPINNTVAVELRDLGAFVHEYGHFIDYNHPKAINTETLSLQKDFSEIINMYTMIYKLNESPYNSTDKYNDSYFLTPTEIFARSFEIYNLGKMGNTNLLHDKNHYNTKYEYKPFKNKNLYSLIEDYFNNLLY